jgi:beta-lactamase superfamily II metal-dependent hydrolase
MPKARPRLAVHVLDVGHGDSILLRFPDSCSFGIVDCHRHPTAEEGGGPKALAHFRRLIDAGEKPVVEFACLTHPHLDHYDGLATLLEGVMAAGVPIKQFWDFGPARPVAEAYRRLAQKTRTDEEQQRASELEHLCRVKRLLQARGCDYRPLLAPAPSFWQGHGVFLDIIAPDSWLAADYINYWLQEREDRKEYGRGNPDVKNHNTISSALRLRYGQFQVLLGGDVTNTTWEAILADRGRNDPSCHALKISHHGSAEGNFPSGMPLWPALAPRGRRLTALISGGYRRSLPHADTLASLRQAGCNVYCTGPVVQCNLTPYSPPDEPVLAPYLGLFEIEEGEVEELGHGDIVLYGYESGRCRVITQFQP